MNLPTLLMNDKWGNDEGTLSEEQRHVPSFSSSSKKMWESS